MPMYTVSCRKTISSNLRQPLAEVIMNTHCGLTGAPETFVNVVYSHNVPLHEGIDVQVFAAVRFGRTEDTNTILKANMHKNISELLDIPKNSLEVTLMEVPASWVMEGGNILPEPGEEDQCEWLKEQDHAA